MKVRHILRSLLVAILLVATFARCSYDKPLVDELPVKREFSPVNLTAHVRNQVNVELNWTADDNAESYIVEFATDSTFNNIIKTVEVTPDELPVTIPLDQETMYSIRVKTISGRGLDDSKWATTSAQTLTEQLFYDGEASDIKAKEVTLRWVANSEVSSITLSPGDITHTITPEEKASGVATVTGLTPETDYTATLLNGTTRRGVKTFTTGIDIGAGILVTPDDNLLQMISEASAGAILVLEKGVYSDTLGTIIIDKPLTIRGLRSYDKPQLHANFELKNGATDVELIDLDVRGDGEGSSTLNNFAEYTEAGNYNSLLISGCNIHDYSRSFIVGHENDAILQNLTVENSIVHDVFTSGGDFIDFRSSDVLNVLLKNSTFYNVASGRDFIRMDASGTSNGTGLTANIVIDQCTIYASSVGGKRLLYVRFDANKITVTQTIIAETDALYSDRSDTDANGTFNYNDYWNAPSFYDSSEKVYDTSTSYFTLDPGFADPSSGDFTISNQTLIDNHVGDPRWRP